MALGNIGKIKGTIWNLAELLLCLMDAEHGRGGDEGNASAFEVKL